MDVLIRGARVLTLSGGDRPRRGGALREVVPADNTDVLVSEGWIREVGQGLAVDEALDVERQGQPVADLASGQMREAVDQCSADTLAALKLAADRITEHHQRQLPVNERYTDEQGVELGWRWTAALSGVAIVLVCRVVWWMRTEMEAPAGPSPRPCPCRGCRSRSGGGCGQCLHPRRRTRR